MKTKLLLISLFFILLSAIPALAMDTVTIENEFIQPACVSDSDSSVVYYFEDWGTDFPSPNGCCWKKIGGVWKCVPC